MDQSSFVLGAMIGVAVTWLITLLIRPPGPWSKSPNIISESENIEEEKDKDDTDDKIRIATDVATWLGHTRSFYLSADRTLWECDCGQHIYNTPISSRDGFTSWQTHCLEVYEAKLKELAEFKAELSERSL